MRNDDAANDLMGYEGRYMAAGQNEGNENNGLSLSAVTSMDEARLLGLLRARLREEMLTLKELTDLNALFGEITQDIAIHCEQLTKSAAYLNLDTDDLIQDTWRKTLNSLREPQGDRVRSIAHLKRLLRKVATNLFLDAYRRVQKARVQPMSLDASASGDGENVVLLGDTVADTRPGPEALLMLSVMAADSRYLTLISFLYRKPVQLKKRFRRILPRRPTQYKAMVLYQFGTYLRDNLRESDGMPNDARIRQIEVEQLTVIAHDLGIPPGEWNKMREAVQAEFAEDVDGNIRGEVRDLFQVVNDLYKTNIQSLDTILSYRSELTRVLDKLPKER